MIIVAADLQHMYVFGIYLLYVWFDIDRNAKDHKQTHSVRCIMCVCAHTFETHTPVMTNPFKLVHTNTQVGVHARERLKPIALDHACEYT